MTSMADTHHAPTGFPELERLRRALGEAGLMGRSKQGSSFEQRREQRVEILTRGTCMSTEHPELDTIMIRNISPNGIHFRIGCLLRIGQEIRIIVCLPSAPPCQMSMRVRWVREAKVGGCPSYLVGAELIVRLSTV